MRQGGVTATFTPRIDAVAGRVDIAITRSGDQAGASGTGCSRRCCSTRRSGRLDDPGQRRGEHARRRAGARCSSAPATVTVHGEASHGAMTEHGRRDARRLAVRTARGERGFTFIELLVVTTILLILASAVMPLARVTVQRAAGSRTAARAARDADRDRQVQGCRGHRPDRRRPTSGPAARAIRRISRRWSRASAWPTTRPAAS